MGHPYRTSHLVQDKQTPVILKTKPVFIVSGYLFSNQQEACKYTEQTNGFIISGKM